ncbi:MAG: UDP-glucose/GDP-mannose dehydrogenase family protein [Rhizobiales bacterium]|nr:UDP-glucose/GDP-mannose dehydrogenase family protein [Hyphomicrobiales bacterium]
MRIAIIGSGYVGLVSGACFADLGHSVTCIDSDTRKIESLRTGVSPFYEPGLEVLVHHNVEAGRLAFATTIAGNVAGADAVFIAVGTPGRRGDGHADLSAVFAATREIARHAQGFTVIVTKSTVPVGTSDDIERVIREENPAADIAVVSNPEFLREGSAISDFRHPDRIVVGFSDERAGAVMTDIYRPLTRDRALLLSTGRRAAELIKYAANAFLALKITFINEIADLCEEAGADVQDIARGIGLDKRIGTHFLQAGPGFGGSCFPKDTLALVKTAQDYGRPLRLIETTVAINEQRKRGMARKIATACGGSVRGKTVAILGLTFKPNTDDMRGAPSLDIIRALQDQGAAIRAFDPVGMEAARPLLNDVAYATDPYDAARGAHALVIVTEWSDFQDLDFPRLKSLMETPVLVDLRNVYRPEDVRRHGFLVSAVGRPAPYRGLGFVPRLEWTDAWRHFDESPRWQAVALGGTAAEVTVPSERRALRGKDHSSRAPAA